MSTLRNININNNVPSGFDYQSESSMYHPIAKGQLNEFDIKPMIINEHVEDSSSVVGIVNSATTIGQIFKASHDNINTIGLSLKSDNLFFKIEDFDSYSASTQLQLTWVGTTFAPLLETGIVSPFNSSQKSMMIDDSVVGDSWVKTLSAATDMSNIIYELDYMQDQRSNKMIIGFFVGDGVNTKSYNLSVANKRIWQQFVIPESIMIEDQIGATNMSAITQIGFRVNKSSGGGFGYIDNINSEDKPSSVKLSLWDFGSTIPVSNIDGLQQSGHTLYSTLGPAVNYTGITFELKGGKRLYHIDEYIAGTKESDAANVSLTIGNYYGIVLDYVDANVVVYGNNQLNGKKYNNGYAFSASNHTAPIIDLGPDKSAMFAVFSTQDVYLNKIEFKLDNIPSNNASVTFWSEDKNDKIISTFKVDEELPEKEEKFTFDLRPEFLPKGAEVELLYNDDFRDNVKNGVIEIYYMYKKENING